MSVGRAHRWFPALLAGCTFEGIGYSIANTFLVAAIQQGVGGRLGGGAWLVVGLQAVGIALSALVGGAGPALVSAVLSGATFMGVSTIALAVGAHLRVSRAVALLTTGYSAGDHRPLLAAPLLRHGYHQALLLGSAMVLLAAPIPSPSASAARTTSPGARPGLSRPARACGPPKERRLVSLRRASPPPAVS
ncbi:hypothetical protein [Streptomyces sp. SAT1]|uniref:hypothetical protein n=1 Tax=Streptomyces sp. SAT1 TaxID=1849967 RepID=UPI003FCC6E9F